ncbi:MAG: diheme cytochrome c-553 [Chitinophagaceae bacterium]
MRRNLLVIGSLCISLTFLISRCAEKQETQPPASDSSKITYGGYESQVKWGHHLTMIQGCNDCHTPKKMTDRGPVLDTALLLSGHPAQMPAPEVNRKEMESKGLAVTMDLTAWVGPWGISYTANLTSDSSGIGNWKEEQFLYALKNGKIKGLADSRTILPPMPWQELGSSMTDDEMKAIFAYLKSTKPVKNIVPPPAPPVSATMAQK